MIFGNVGNGQFTLSQVSFTLMAFLVHQGLPEVLILLRAKPGHVSMSRALKKLIGVPVTGAINLYSCVVGAF